MISKILVPTDGSRAARKAAMYTVDLAKQLKATVPALRIIDKRSFMGQTVPARETAGHVTPVDLTLQIAKRAYELYEQGSCGVELGSRPRSRNDQEEGHLRHQV